MGTALVAILLAFTQTEGCGSRISRIEAVSFSRDGLWIAVSKLNARVAHTPGKLYKADVARTLSLLDSSVGMAESWLRQDFQSGNQGAALELWCPGRESALLNPLTNRFLAIEFGGGALLQYSIHRQTEPILITPPLPAWNLALSGSGRYVALGGVQSVSVWDMSTGESIMEVWPVHATWLRHLHMSFSTDETRIVTAGYGGVHVWDIATSKVATTLIDGSDLWIQAVSFLPDDTVVVCSDRWVRRYEMSGEVHSTLVDAESETHRGCSVSPDGQLVAVIDSGNIVVYDLATGESKPVGTGMASAISFSPNSRSLAVGTWKGIVSLIDVGNGKERWSVSPPSRNRLPWTVVMPFLALWGFTAWRLWRRRRA